MNCSKCGTKMIILELPSETYYQEVHKRKLWVCPRCGFEREFRGGGKNR